MKKLCVLLVFALFAVVMVSNALAQPTIAISNKNRIESDDLRHIVTLSAAAGVDVYYTFTTSDGSALAGSDYVAATNQQVRIPAGQTLRHAVVDVIDDNIQETDETLTVTITGAWLDDGVNTPIVITNAVATGTINDDDPVPSISIRDKSQVEDFPDELRVVVTLSNPSIYDVYFTWSTSDGTALVSDNDYTPETDKQVMIKGDVNRVNGHAVVEMIDDTYYENDETLTVTLTGAYLDDGNQTPLTITNDAATGTILNDDAMPVVSFKKDDFSTKELNPCPEKSETKWINMQVVLDKPATGWEEITVHLRTNPAYRHPEMVWKSSGETDWDIDDTGDGWDDKDVTITFDKDDTKGRARIRIRKDCMIEEDEWQQFILLYEKNLTVDNQKKVASITIKNDDCLPVADFDVSAVEGIDPFTVQFTNKSTCAGEFLWDFGDGETSTEENPEHTFRNPPHKYYDVTLTAYSADCCEREDTIVKANLITVHRAADVAFNAMPIVGVPGSEFTFMNKSAGAANKFTWKFGDGTELETQHSVMVPVHPTHVYEDAGEYDVCLKGEGHGGMDKMEVPNLIYVDENYVALELLEGSATLDGQGWDDAIDHDVISPDASVTAMNDDACAKFRFADSTVKMITKLRIAVNNAGGSRLASNLAKDFKLMVSEDGENWTEALAATIPENPGYNWDVFAVEPAAKAKYLKLKLCNARGDYSPYVSLCEFQVFATEEVGGEVESVALDKAQAEAAAAAVVEIPTEYALQANYPNPFNPETMISYQLPEEADVTLRIYNIRGQLINTLVNARVAAGVHNVVWNGNDVNGQEVAGGMYIYKIVAKNSSNESFTLSRKMTFLK